MSQSRDITCKELIDFLADYVDQLLPVDQRRDFDAHLELCPSCMNYLDAYKKTIAIGKTAFAATDDPARSKAPEGLLRAVKNARRHAVR